MGSRAGYGVAKEVGVVVHGQKQFKYAHILALMSAHLVVISMHTHTSAHMGKSSFNNVSQSRMVR
jgi:hypothetical protein